MDFFARQEKARRQTRWLEVYFACAVIGVVLSVYLAAVVGEVWFQSGHHRRSAPDATALLNPQLLLGTTICTLAFIGIASLYKMSQLAAGGSVVAEMLGGRPVTPNTTDPDEHKLLNVVQEMSIAAGTPVPQIFLLDQERGINAFAAGHSSSDTAICVTRGAIKLLDRDELQGVIGHEFSHILNGDMRLNLRLMGMVFGILCLALFGRILLNTRGRKNPLPVAGLALIVIGSVGVFFAKLIKSAVNRQREFLADAAAVQFTRNPGGLAGALKKVGGCSSRIEDPNAEDASHFFFANGLEDSWDGLFSTHPPLKERIRELDPSFDGKFTHVDLALVEDPVESALPDAKGTGKPGVLPTKLARTIGGPVTLAAMGAGGIQARQVLNHAGTLTPQHLEYAADLRANLTPALSGAASEPFGAVALIYALLLSRDESMRGSQLGKLQAQVDPAIHAKTLQLLPEVSGLPSRARLPLATLAISALRQLSAPQYEQFSANLKSLVESDGQIDFFEYAVQKMVSRQLEPRFKPPRKTVVQYYVLRPLVQDCSVLLSVLARAGETEPQAVTNAFEQGAQSLNEPGLVLLDSSATGLKQLDTALDDLNMASPLLKRNVLSACAATVAADGVIQETEAELLRAIADTLDCPIPPFLVL